MILGLDPGLTGALAWVRSDGALIDAIDIPVIAGEVSAVLLLSIDLVDVEHAVMEWPGIMPKNGAKSARSMGMSIATLHTWLTCRQVPTTRVSPGTWKRQMGLSADKEHSRALALRTWPYRDDLFKRKKDADRAEAALLALWWLTKAEGRHLVVTEAETA